MLRLLLDEPNVLLLDEPTNDLDIETLNVLEDFLDGWPGTLVVVSHDRYFLERVCDTVWALLGDGTVRMLPRGVDEYLERREAALRAGAGGAGVGAGAAAVGNGRGVAGASEDTRPSNPPSISVASQPGVSTGGPASSASASGSGAASAASAGPAASAGEMREAKKAMARIDRQLTKLANREAELHAQLAEHAADYEKLAELDARLRELAAEKESLEEEWLEAASLLE